MLRGPMRPPYARLPALVLLFSASGLAAQDLTPRTFPIKSVESWSYRSPGMDQTYDISVGLPTRTEDGRRWW